MNCFMDELFVVKNAIRINFHMFSKHDDCAANLNDIFYFKTTLNLS